MTRDELLQQLEHTRNELNALLEGVPADALIRPGAYGNWSVKDVLVHISRWEAEIIKVLFQAQQGGKPQSEIFNPEYLKVNDLWHQEAKDRPLERVLEDFSSVHTQLVRRLKDFPEKALITPGNYPWMKHALIDLVKDIAVDHEQEHLEGLKVLLASLSA